MDDLTPKRHVFIEGVDLVVRASTLEELRLALRELKLMKRELKTQRKIAAVQARTDCSNVRQSVNPKHHVLMAVQLDVAKSPLRELDARILVVESMEHKVEATILQSQFK